MRKRFTWIFAFLAILGGVALMVADAQPAFAAASSTPSCTSMFDTSVPALPWECVLQKILKSLRGPTAMAVSMLGIVVAGWGLIWGGELGEFAKRAIMLTLVLSFIMGTNVIVGKLRSGANAVASGGTSAPVQK